MALKRKAAAFTIVQNEPRFLPVWWHHYAGTFANQDIYVLDHNSTDAECVRYLYNLTAGTDVNVVPVHRGESYNHAWLSETVQLFQRFLLQSYQCVLFTEADEIVTPSPSAHLNLDQYIDQFLARPERCVRCDGFEVVHDHKNEPVIDWDRPLLRQRSLWAPSPIYSKVLLAKVPLRWGLGFHQLELPPDNTVPTDPRLALLHLHRLDYHYGLAKHREQAGRKWCEEDRAHHVGFQNWLAEPAQYEEWFYHPERFWHNLPPLRLEPIPEHWKDAL